VNDEPARRLSRDDVLALTFAAHRQLARWANSSTPLRPRQRDRRAALIRAVRVLQDDTFAHGCELRTSREE
jgi:hypothetical protein